MLVIERVETKMASLGAFNATLYVRNTGNVPIMLNETRVHYSLFSPGERVLLPDRALLTSINITRSLNPGEAVEIIISELPLSIERMVPMYEIDVVTMEGAIATARSIIVALEALINHTKPVHGEYNASINIYVVNYGSAEVTLDRAYMYVDGSLERIITLEPVKLSPMGSENVSFDATLSSNRRYYFKVGGGEEALSLWPAVIAIKIDATPISNNYSVDIYAENLGSIPITIKTIYILSEEGAIVYLNSTLDMTIEPNRVEKVVSNIILSKGSYCVFLDAPRTEVRKWFKLQD